MEKDITSAEKDAKQKQKSLEQTVAANKAEDIAKLKGGDSSKDKESDNGSEAASAVDDNGAPTGNVKNITEELTKRVPEEVFAQFDTDGSGYIDFDEFRAMLPHVGIKISMPKVSKDGNARSITTVRVTLLPELMAKYITKKLKYMRGILLLSLLTIELLRKFRRE